MVEKIIGIALVVGGVMVIGPGVAQEQLAGILMLVIGTAIIVGKYGRTSE